MHPTTLHRTVHPTRRRPRRLALTAMATLAGTSAVLGLAAGPASAVDEFPPAPTAEASMGCDDGGAVITLDLGNVSGLSGSHFEYALNGSSPTGFDVAAFSSGTILLYSLTENTDATVTVTGPNGFAFEETFAVDCYDFVGGVTLTCDGLQPLLTAEVTAIGEYGDEVRLELGPTTVGSEQLASGTSTTFTAEVPNEEPFAAELLSLRDGVIADLVGTPHCALPTTTTSTTAVPVTATPTVPTQVISQELGAPAPYVAPVAAPTELPRTGSSTVPLAVVGTTLLGLGIAARRFAARRA